MSQNSATETSPPPPSALAGSVNANDPDEMEAEATGEDLNENLETDYRSIPELDVFDTENLDSEDYDRIDPVQRRAAERALEDRERREGRRSRRPRFLPSALADDDEELPFGLSERKLDLGPRLMDTEEAHVNIDDYTGPLREYLGQERVRAEVRRRFRALLTQFIDEDDESGGNKGIPKYPQRITKMCQENNCSLNVSYIDITRHQPVLAIWVADVPSIMLELFSEEAMAVAKYEFANYDRIHPQIHVRIPHLPLSDQLRELRQIHLNAFIQVNGVVTRRTNVFPQLRLVKFDCLKCGFVIGPFAQTGGKEVRPPSCPDCQGNGPFRLNEGQTIYRNYQKIVLQESPGSVPAGRIPRSRDVILVDDLCDSVRPGEQIQVTGIYKHVFEASLNVMNGFPVFGTVIEANHIVKERDFFSQYVITDEDRQAIIRLSKRKDLESILLKSCAPSIFGHEYIKRALLCALFAGQEKKHKNKHRVRGDINVLILGDPGTAKSQFLRYVEKLAFRAVYATGKGASAVGLTASVRRDPITREWTLEGGALVLADRGVCLIDEFDKMNDQDRTSIHEAMEQQSISISKAGIVASLQARCSVIAAANPIKGRYDGSLTFVENVDLTDPILSRFDVLAVVRDRVDPIMDEKLAHFVVGNHIKSHPNSPSAENEEDDDDDDDAKDDEKRSPEEEARHRRRTMNGILKSDGSITQTMLRKYILYAKTNCKPKLDHINRDKIAKFYGDLRQKSMTGGGIPIAVRHIESILRLAEARAKMHLREYVRGDDVDMAIRTMLESFIDTQKQSVQASLRHHFKSYLSFKRDSTQLLLHVLAEEVQEELEHRRLTSSNESGSQDKSPEPVEIDMKLFEERAESMGITNLAHFLKSDAFKNEGFTVSPDSVAIVKTFD